MYASVMKFKVKSGHEDETKVIVSRILKSFKGVKGFVSAVIYFDEETNELGRTTVWETKEDAVANRNSVPPKRHERDMEVADGPVENKGYDVLGYVTAD